MKVLPVIAFLSSALALPTQIIFQKGNARLIKYADDKVAVVTSELLDEIAFIKHARVSSSDMDQASLTLMLLEKYSDICSPEVIRSLLKPGYGTGYMDITEYVNEDDEDFLFKPRDVPFNAPANEKSLEIQHAVDSVQAKSIENTIKHLSNSFVTRNHRSSNAVKVAQWIKEQFEGIAKEHSRDDITVQFFSSSSSKQPSVIVSIKGSLDPDSVVIVGAHEDSISSRFSVEARAPGADDDASGIATIIETFRIILEQKYYPKKTLQFMAFSAEEYGLLGSQAIARSYRRNNVNVLAMMQVEMNGYKSDGSLVILKETSSKFAQYLQKLAKLYLPNLKTKLSNCEYGCSDHYSFYTQKFPATAIAEAGPSDRSLNPNIHSIRDTLDKLDVEQISEYAKLTVAFAIDMTK